MDQHAFEDTYTRMTDWELAKVMRDRRDLVPTARAALDREVERRGLGTEQLRKMRPHSIDKPRHKTDLERRLGKKRIRGAWLVAAMAFAFLLAVILDSFKALQLFWPINITIVVPVFTVWGHLELKRRLWFWVAIATITAAHAVVFYFVAWPWGTKWVWARVIEGICTLDLMAVFGLISLVEKLLGEDRASELK